MQIKLYVEYTGWCCVFETNDELIFDCVCDITKMLRGKVDYNNIPNHNIIVEKRGVYYHLDFYVFKPNNQHFSCVFENIEYLLFFVYHLINFSFNQFSLNEFAIFHGASFSYRENSYALIAPSKVGKSTLIYHLCLHGYDYMGDDHVIYDLDYDCCKSFPKAIAIRDLNCILQKTNYIETIDPDNKTKYLFYKFDSFVNTNKSKKLDKLFILDRKSEKISAYVEILSSIEAFQYLLFNGKDLFDLTKNKKAARMICEKHDAYVLHYFDTNSAINEIDKLIKVRR